MRTPRKVSTLPPIHGTAPASGYTTTDMPSSIHSEKYAKSDIEKVEYTKDVDPDAEFGGPEARKKLEKKLLRIEKINS